MKALRRFLSHGALFATMYLSMAVITAFASNNNYLLDQISTFSHLAFLIIVSGYRGSKLNIKWLPILPTICFGIPFIALDLLELQFNSDDTLFSILFGILILSFAVGLVLGFDASSDPNQSGGLGDGGFSGGSQYGGDGGGGGGGGCD